MSDLKKFTIPIKGLHCRSCEILVENQLKEIEGISKVLINYRQGQAEIFYDKEKPELEKITKAIEKAGYSVGKEKNSGLISKDKNDYKELGIAFLILIVLYFIFKNLGITNINITPSPDGLSIWFVLLVGLTAGVSTCMALVGGLILGLSAKHNELQPEATILEKFRPHLFFNLGRIISYALLGGLLGLIGSTIQLSGLALGILTIAVGLVMLILGLQLIKIFPWANKLKFTLPKTLSRALGIDSGQKEYSHKNSMILGGLTFFLPCGFTQAMQVLAISTGNFFSGAGVMGLFALGTIPGLLSVGGLTSLVKGSASRKFFKFAGLVVLVFAIFNLSNGFNLIGFNLIGFNFSHGQAENVKLNDQNVNSKNSIQIIKMAETSNGYLPNSFIIKKGVLVKWIIDAKAPYSCASSIIMPKFNIRKNLVQGENIIEFMPTETGQINFSCSMGMYTGVFNVIE